MAIEDIDPNDYELIDNQVRDSLIKAFMVIFTNEHSQHLLLNKDLIDIALNCLENASQCTLEAKLHVARLISIIFKFPQVQESILGPNDVIKGICKLLSLKKNEDVTRHTIKACTYLSMNFEFISESKHSLPVLHAMMELLDNLSDRHDQFNIILTIKNILKGAKNNKMYFYENGGFRKFVEVALNHAEKEPHDLQIIEMSLGAIAEEATYKKIMVKILADELDTKRLRRAIEVCLDLTDDWPKISREMTRSNLNSSNAYIRSAASVAQSAELHAGAVSVIDSAVAQKTIVTSRNTNDSPKGTKSGLKQSQSKFSYSLEEDSNIEIPEFMKNDLRALGQQMDDAGIVVPPPEEPEDRTKVHKLAKIRNSVYFIIARAIKFGMNTAYLTGRCNILARINKDLSMQEENTYIFQNLLLVINNLKLDGHVIVDLVESTYRATSAQVQTTSDKDKRVALLKVFINWVLEACVVSVPSRPVFKWLFDLAQDGNRHSDDLMIE